LKNSLLLFEDSICQFKFEKLNFCAIGLCVCGLEELQMCL